MSSPEKQFDPVLESAVRERTTILAVAATALALERARQDGHPGDLSAGSRLHVNILEEPRDEARSNVLQLPQTSPDLHHNDVA